MSFEVEGGQVPAMAAELVARGIEPMPDAVFARLPRQTADMLPLKFKGGADAIPAYSFADLYARVSKGDKSVLMRNFGGQLGVVGTVVGVTVAQDRARRR